jgi:hypothetical protein
MWHIWETGEVHTGLWWEDLMKRNHFEYLGVDGNDIKMGLQEVRLRSMDCIDLAQDRDRWRAVVGAVMNLRVP